jgi:AcrR family transcriptional regulator
MSTARAYRARRRSTRAEQTRAKIVAAVRELLAEAAFHQATVDEVAARAGIARATLYQHFHSRLDLINAICDTMGQNPALLAIRDGVEHPDPNRALLGTIANSVRFWSAEDPVLAQIYGITAIDDAAEDFVRRQRDDRRGEMTRLAHHLRATRRLRTGVSERHALAQLMMLTSYDAYRELRHAGLRDAEITKTLQQAARHLLTA